MQTSSTEVPSKAPRSPVEFLQRLFENGEYSDFTVKCGERTWHVHRAIICSRSKYFKSACNSGFSESAQGVITLEDDPLLIEALLLFLYTMRYPNQPSAPRKPEDLFFHAKVYGIGDKYNVLDLKDSAKKAFEQFLRGDCDLAIFSGVASLVYNLTVEEDRGLRDIWLCSLWASKATLLPRQDIQDSVMAHGGFQRDVLKKVFLDSGPSLQESEQKSELRVLIERKKAKKRGSAWQDEEHEVANDPGSDNQWGIWRDYGNSCTQEQLFSNVTNRVS
ncbi:hypothetical protein MMC30_001821 [Trapelia coarctata]|nr:hypothetical protein [Trapelia coarctata]